MYSEDELLMLSGISHFCYCKRQWSLIHIEKQWSENKFTVEGEILHKNADDPFFTQKRKDIVLSRAMPVVSYSLGLYGVCDVIEFEKADRESSNSVEISGRKGPWKINPVEYKRGDSKSIESDSMQLCAQAICLEEMFNTKIDAGYLYYASLRQRKEICLTEDLRKLVFETSEVMHKHFTAQKTLDYPNDDTKCRGCSLKGLCLPELKFLKEKETL